MVVATIYVFLLPIPFTSSEPYNLVFKAFNILRISLFIMAVELHKYYFRYIEEILC